MIEERKVNRLKAVLGAVFGIILTLVTIILRSNNIEYTDIILVSLFFANVLPSSLMYGFLTGERSLKQMFIKGISIFYSIEFITWIVTFDVYRTLITRFTG